MHKVYSMVVVFTLICITVQSKYPKGHGACKPWGGTTYTNVQKH